MATQHNQKSKQKIGVTMATIIGVNAMIGASIFTIPAQLQLSVGPAGILTYALVIVAVWFMALSLARVAERYPEEGSFYVYAKQWGGHTLGVIAAGAYLIGLTIALGLLTRITGSYLHEVIPQYSAQVLGLLSLALLVVLNMAGAVLSKAGQIVLIIFTILPLVAITVLCLTKASFANLVPFMPYGLKNIFAATKAVVFGFFGFEAAASLYSLVNRPEKNVARAITYAIIITSAVYLLFVVSIFLALPRAYFTDATVPLSHVLLQAFPQQSWLVKGIHCGILVTIMGTVHSMIWSLSALLIACAKRIGGASFQLTQRQAVLVIGLAVGISALAFKSLNLFFSLTALFIIVGLALSIVPLVLPYKNGRTSDKVIGTLGLIAAALIFICAFDGVIQALYPRL